MKTAALLLCAATVFAMLAPVSLPWPFGAADKLLHLALFGTLALVAALACRPRPMLGVSGILALAIGLELAQAYAPGRGVESLDLAANLIGVSLGGLAALIREARTA